MHIRIKIECPQCKGRGKIWKERQTLNYVTKFELIPCPTCRGMGYLIREFKNVIDIKYLKEEDHE